MFKKVKKGAEYVFDTYRTAFFGETYLLVAGVFSYDQFNNIAESFEKSISSGIASAIPILAITLSGSALTYLQFKRRSRLERIIKERGYSDDHFRGYLNSACDRQTAYVAAKRTGFLEEFLPLYQGRSPKDHSS